MEKIQAHIAKVAPIVCQHMLDAQNKQSPVYSHLAQRREFQPGDHVLLLIPMVNCKFLSHWQAPYTIIESVGLVNYCLQ